MKTSVELSKELLQNRESLDKSEPYFKESVGKLSNFRRAQVFDHIRLLEQRIALLEQLRNADAALYLKNGPCNA